MQDIAIVLRYGRAVVSQRITVSAGLGWRAADNWQRLEVLAQAEVDTARAAGHPGPAVFPCSGPLAGEAIWPSPGQGETHR